MIRIYFKIYKFFYLENKDKWSLYIRDFIEELNLNVRYLRNRFKKFVIFIIIMLYECNFMFVILVF